MKLSAESRPTASNPPIRLSVVPPSAPAERVVIAQLGAGPDGFAVLARRGEELFELVQPSFPTGSPRWQTLDKRLRLAAAVDHPAVRAVIAVEQRPPMLVIESEDAPAFAELISQAAVDLARATAIVGQLARAVAAVHRVGLAHGQLHPWSIQVTHDDRVRIELTGLVTRAADHTWIRRCRAPELDVGVPVDAAADVYALGTLLDLFAGTRAPSAQLRRLIDDMLQPAPELRPSAADVANRLDRTTPTARGSIVAFHTPIAAAGTRLGRFELVAPLGEDVWTARDLADGPDVAIKVLAPRTGADAELLRRFSKDARTLSAIASPYLTNIIDLNEDDGMHYVVLERVAGTSVADAIAAFGPLPDKLALAIVTDACRALEEPHRHGLAHGAVTTDRLVFVRPGLEHETAPVGQVIKLTGFGIARFGNGVVEPPADATPATDVADLGRALRAMCPMHPAVAALASRCTGESPIPGATAPRDASELLEHIELLLDDSAVPALAHPAPEVVNSRAVQTYAFEWELKATPEALWPFVSNTEKMNRASGLAAAKFETELDKTFGYQRVAGMDLQWQEHPYEWIEGKRHAVLRVFEKGVLRWYVAEVTLERLPNGGTKLCNTIRMEPRGTLAKIVSKYEMGVRYRGALDRIYRRLDQQLAAGPAPYIDPLDPEVVLPIEARARLDRGQLELGRVVDARAAEAVVAYLGYASDQDVARIRPLELADRCGVGEDELVGACLHAARLGLVEMVWDVICPSCKIASSVVESLSAIEEHAHCQSCKLDYTVDFSRAIELAFRAAPAIREIETRTFCIGGPAHFPHVVAQVRLAPGERLMLPLSLAPGYYVVRSAQLAASHEVRVTANGGVRRVDITAGEGGELGALAAGEQLVTLVNPGTTEVVMRVERAGDRAFALTAARVMANATFRALFPDQGLAPGRLMAVTQATIMVAQLDHSAALFDTLGDERAFPLAREFFELAAAMAAEHGGTLIKTFGGVALAAFDRPTAAVDCALALQAAVDANPSTAHVRAAVAVHRGPMMALTQGGRLDYFGKHVQRAVALIDAVPAGAIAFTEAMCCDAGVAKRLMDRTERLALIARADGSWAQHVRAK